MSIFDQLVNKANDSAEFRAKLVADPAGAAKEAGVTLPAGATLVVHEDTINQMNLVIGGQTEDLPDEALQLLAKAQQDAKYKAKLINDPIGMARVEFGTVLPTSLSVVVHENTASQLHVVLPPTESAEGELSDMELEAVAGGKSRSRSRSRSSSSSSGGGSYSSGGSTTPGCIAICTS